MPEAAQHLEQAVRLQPDFGDAHYYLGIALFRLGRGAEAISHLELGLKSRPDDAAAHGRLGAALLQQGRIAEAITHLEQAVRIQPDYADAHGALGFALFQQGKVEEAIEHLDQAVQLTPGDAGLQKELAWLLATSGNGTAQTKARAVELAEGANRLTGGKDAATLDTLAAAFAEAGRFDEAIRTVQTAIDLMRANGQTEQTQPLQQRLRLYQAGQPFRQELGSKQ